MIDRQGFNPVKYSITISIAHTVRTICVLLTRGMASIELRTMQTPQDVDDGE